HAYPARAVLVLLALAVPEELHLDAAVLVGVQLLAGGADDDGGLRPHDHRARRLARRAERHLVGDAGERVGVRRAALVAVAGVGGLVADGSDGVGLAGLAL